MAFCALDLGGTRLKAGRVNATGSVEDLVVQDLPPNPDARAALNAIERATTKLTDGHPCEGMGLSVPGLVEDGVITSLHTKFPGIVGQDLRAFCEEKLGMRAVVANDAIAYGVGEAMSGAGRGHRRVVAMTIGTGVGVSVVEDGRPLGRGHLGGGLLGGFIPIADDDIGPTDSIGRRGTIEALCAAQRIVDYAHVGDETFDSIPEVYAAYMNREAAAIQGIKAYRRQLRRALVALAHAHAPGVIVIGGGPLTQKEPLMEGLEGDINGYLWPGYEVRVRAAALGDAAALVGLYHLHGRER